MTYGSDGPAGEEGRRDLTGLLIAEGGPYWQSLRQAWQAMFHPDRSDNAQTPRFQASNSRDGQPTPAEPRILPTVHHIIELGNGQRRKRAAVGSAITVGSLCKHQLQSDA